MSRKKKLTLGEKIYAKLNAKLTNKPQLDDEDSQKLQESLNAMALFFDKLADASYDTCNLFTVAFQSCKDMADAVANHTTDTLEDEDYSNFDDAWEAIFPDGENDYSTLKTKLNELNKTTVISTNTLDQPINPSTLEQINRIRDKYREKTSGLRTTTNAGKNLIKGIRGLQTYIDKDLDEKIKHVEKGIEPYQQRLEESSGPYLKSLMDSLDSSKRWFQNSSEYGEMLNSAKALYAGWGENASAKNASAKNAIAKKRKKLAAAAYRAANKYINSKRGRNNTDKNWTPITKEGKKRFKLAQYLLETVTDLFGEDLKNPDKEDLIDDVNILENNILEKKEGINTSGEKKNENENENEDDINKNNENNIIDKVTSENNIIENNESDINKNNEINTSEKKENDINKNNAINIIKILNSEKNEDKINIIATNNKIDPEESSRQSRIKAKAKDLLANYNSFYPHSNAGDAKNAIVATAAAVNVLMQLGINDTQKPEPDQIFTTTNIDDVTEAVKKTKWFNEHMYELELMVTEIDNDIQKLKVMEQQYINALSKSMGNLNINFGASETGPATNTPNQLDQNLVKNIDGNKPNKKIDTSEKKENDIPKKAEDDISEMKEDLTLPDNNTGETDKKNLIENNIIVNDENNIIDNKKSDTSEKKDTSENKKSDIIEEKIKFTELDIIDGKIKIIEINPFNDKSNLIEDENSGESEPSLEMREWQNKMIRCEAEIKFFEYIEYGDKWSSKYNTPEKKEDCLAKAAAVNVIMQLALNGAFDSEYTTDQLFSNENGPTKIFNDKQIDEVAAAVKKLPSFMNQDKFAKMVFKNKDNINENNLKASNILMDTKDIHDLITSMYEKNLIGFPKAGLAANQSPQLNQGMHTNGKKSNVKGMKL